MNPETRWTTTEDSMTVTDLIHTLVNHVQAGRCQPTSEVVSAAEGFALRPRVYLGMVLMEPEPRLELAIEPSEDLAAKEHKS